MTGVAGAPFYSNLFFNEAATPDPTTLVSEVAAFWQATADYSALGMSGTVEGAIPTIDPATGDIVSVENVAQDTFTGGRAGNLLPPATQGLLRLLTGTYEAGRQVRGRVFIPALSVEAGTAVPGSGTINAWNNAAAALIADALDAGYEWVVWSRKNGVQRTITSVAAWQEYSVLRSRRD